MSRSVACVLLMLFVSLPIASSTPAYELIDRAHKIVSGPDEDGDLEISFRVTVKNLRDTKLAVRVIAQGIDEEDFVTYDLYLDDTLGPHETRVIRDLDFISDTKYSEIVKWDWVLELQ